MPQPLSGWHCKVHQRYQPKVHMKVAKRQPTLCKTSFSAKITFTFTTATPLYTQMQPQHEPVWAIQCRECIQQAGNSLNATGKKWASLSKFEGTHCLMRLKNTA